MAELIKDACGVDIRAARDLDSLRAAVREAGVAGVNPGAAKTWALLVDELFDATVEPQLVQPIFVVDYPTELSPLAKKHSDDPSIVERFEVFVDRVELSNAFSELNDPDDQRERFEAQRRAAESGDDEAQPIDEDFLRALEHGMPPTGGMGLGIGASGHDPLGGVPPARDQALPVHEAARCLRSCNPPSALFPPVWWR